MYITSKNVREGRLDLSSLTYVLAAVHQTIYSACPVRMGDILFVKDGVNTGIAAVNSIESQFSMLSSVALLRPRADSLNGKFLMHWLNSPAGRGQMLRNMSGAAIKRLVLGQIREAEIPLPPLDEQRRIAAILDQADELRRKRREALERLQAFKTISFETMFLGLHAADTPLGTIQDLTATTQYGTSSKAGETGEFPILRMGNITYEGELDRRDMKFIDLAPREVAKYTVVPGDILFNRTNSPDLVGKTAVFRGEERLAFAGYLVRLRTNDRADPEYVSAYLNSKRGKAILRGMCKTIIGMSNINAQELRSIPIPLPPLPLQGAFAARVAEIDRLKSHHRAHLEKLDALFASLQHRAFRGELSGAKEPCETETA